MYSTKNAPLGQIGNTHGLSTEEELNANYSERLKFVPQAQDLCNSKKANKGKGMDVHLIRTKLRKRWQSIAIRSSLKSEIL
jgi:hypothetical protein